MQTYGWSFANFDEIKSQLEVNRDMLISRALRVPDVACDMLISRALRVHGNELPRSMGKLAKEVVSRSKAFTGVTWIDALLKKWDMTKFNAAADSLGELL